MGGIEPPCYLIITTVIYMVSLESNQALKEQLNLLGLKIQGTLSFNHNEM